METISEIKRRIDRDQKILDIKRVYNDVERNINKIYYGRPCEHDIVIRTKASEFICLGCMHKVKYDEKIYIIDFSDNYYSTKYIGEYNLLVSYLQSIMLEACEKLDNFTDSDFIEMVETNKKYVVPPFNYNPYSLLKKDKKDKK